jgi:hypothetical protein
VVFLQHLARKHLTDPTFHCAERAAKLPLIAPIGIQEINMLKYVIIATASCALVGSAAAADLPHPQPVYKEAPVGKMPIGKAPIGKAPLGKAPIVTKG